jgi:hypothetical protein
MEQIKDKVTAGKMITLFDYVQKILEDDRNLTKSGLLKAGFIEEIKNRLKELFEEKINVIAASLEGDQT